MSAVVFYCTGGFESLLLAVQNHGEPDTQYYFILNAPVGHKQEIRAYDFDRLRGKNTHPAVELHRNAYDGDWLEVGRSFRAKMDAAGLLPDEMWAINEASSGMRKKSHAVARDGLRDLVKGLGTPPGIVFQQGVGPLKTGWQRRMYRRRLGFLLSDDTFWRGIEPYVRWYAFETYASPSAFSAMSPRNREYFLFQPLIDARHGHPDAARVLRDRYMPVLNAHGGSGYGNESVTLDFIEEQKAVVYQRRRWENVAWAWNEANGMTLASAVVS